LDQMQALSDQYIGSLPKSQREYQAPGLKASAKRQRIVHRGNQPTRADMFFYYVQSASNELERFDAELLLMREVLAQRLWHVLREREGLGYDVSLQLRRRAFLRGGSSFTVGMVCDPNYAPEVRRRVDEVLLSLLVNGIDELELAPLRSRLSADYSELLRDNATLLAEWANQRERGRSIAQVLHTVAEIEAVDAKRLQQYARLFFKETGFLEVNVVPGLSADLGAEQAALVQPTR
ncbi:MAG: insulinase family protein, partial [Granulosicoccaceae bacterium]